MRNLVPGASALALALGLAGAAAADGATAWRLFVADHARPVVTALDALDGTALGSFTLKGTATLVGSDSGAAVFAVQGGAGAVSAIASGIVLDDHGDHADLDLAPPRLTGAEFNGTAPSHFVQHGGQWAAFFDGEGLARGAAVFAVQGGAGAVSVIASGIVLDDHGDHADLDLAPPRLTGAEFTGTAPSHFVQHGGEWAAFFDGEGLARVFDEAAALEGRAAFREVAADAPHHGVAIPFGRHDLVSVPDPADPAKPPVGVKVLDRNGNQVGAAVDCTGLHGEAGSGDLVALGGCPNGILIVRDGGDGPAVRTLDFPADLPSGRTSTLLGGRGLQYFLGNHGPQAVVLIDPADPAPFRRIDLPTRRVHFAVDPVRPRLAWIFTEDGELRRLDVVAGALTGAVRLTGPYSMDGHWSDPRPRIAVAGDFVFVTDPLAGRIHRVDAETLQPAGSIAVEGRPFNIVAVGGSGRTH